MQGQLRVAVMLGKLGAAVHGRLDAARAFDSGSSASTSDSGSFMTGTVAGFLTIVWGLAERGHHVDAFCDAKETALSVASLGGANVYPMDEKQPDGSYDVYVSILEPDLLRTAPAGKPRILVQWLNDFSYCKRPGWEEHVDVYVSPSQTHATYLTKKAGVPPSRIVVLPLAVNPELHEPGTKDRRQTIAYASSPDRGLHHILEWFPEIRRRVPGSELRVYYRVLPWMEEILREPGLRGSKQWKRAKAVKEAFEKQGVGGENGLTLVGPLPQRELARELANTKVLAYPCDPVRFTEGFSLTVLDACAAGCVPIIAGVDSLTELWWNAAVVIPGAPSEKNREVWTATICRALEEPMFAVEAAVLARSKARELTRQAVAVRWESLIKSSMMMKEHMISGAELAALVAE